MHETYYKQKALIKVTDLNPTTSVIFLNVSRPNVPIIRNSQATFF